MTAKNAPSQSEFLASLVTGNAGITQFDATVQRSHRFPLIMFAQIENLAKIGTVPMSLIINQLIECGLEAVKKELPDEVLKKMSIVSQDQIRRVNSNDKIDIPLSRAPSKDKPKSSLAKK